MSAVALAALIVGLSGCIDQTRAANEAIARANGAADEYAATDIEITRLLDEATSVDFTPDGVKLALAALDEARARVEERHNVVSAIRAEFASISSLRVSDEVKQYAMMQVAIADLLAQADEQALDLIDATKAFYERIASRTADTEEGRALAERLAKASEEIERLSEMIEQKRAEADVYFDQHLVGRR